MVYVEEISREGRKYFRLVHAMREKGRVLHKRKYLGISLPPEKRLEYLKKEFLKELAGGKYRLLSKEDFEAIEKKRLEHNLGIKRLSFTEKEKYLDNFMIRFTYDSSKLSGMDITLRQTSLILKDGIIPKDFKSLKTANQLESHKKGIVAITEYDGRLNLGFIKKLHSILFAGIDDSIAGKLRSELKRNVKIAGTAYIPPKWDILDKEIGLFFKWYNSENRKLHPLELAALVHLKMISLQPFVDGNSRLSRLLMNWVLWKKDYPLIDIPIEDLEEYYDVLDKYQIEKDEKPFVDFIKKKFMEIEY